MFPAIFLDRDGVLIENRPDYVRNWAQVKILPNIVDTLASNAVKNYKKIIVTNQSAVGRGLITLEAARNINENLVRVIENHHGKIHGVYMCPHAPGAQCSCRKPKPGLILQAAHDLSLDLGRSWMIGDAWSDLLAGRAAGVPKVGILKTGRGSEQLLQQSPDNLTDYFVFNDLVDAVRTIQKIDANSTS
jgi:D-glycero-D-manno-heptose 1,7-bisphosphate phosphatase